MILRRLIGLLVLLGAIKLAQSKLGTRAVDGLLAQFWQNRTIQFNSSTGSQPWSTKRAGALMLPGHIGAPFSGRIEATANGYRPDF